MKLYFSPLACSLAPRIASYEAGAQLEFIEVHPETKQTADGADYLRVHALGLVPALALSDGELLTENSAILEHIADNHPEAALTPREPRERSRLRSWLCFVATELHKGVYTPLLDRRAPEGARSYALDKAPLRLSYLEAHLQRREFLLDSFSVADAYAFTILNWSQVTPIDLGAYPAIGEYVRRMKQRPSVARALAEEKPLYLAERARTSAA